jgi:plastocyanin
MRSSRLGLIAIVSMLMVGCGGGSSSTPTTPTPTPTTPSPAPAAGVVAVSIPVGATTLGTRAYNPNPVTVAPGTTVRWTNDDSIAHTSTSNGSTFSSGTLNPGDHFDFMFPTAGTFPYHCTFHAGMVGTIVVQ